MSIDERTQDIFNMDDNISSESSIRNNSEIVLADSNKIIIEANKMMQRQIYL